jgi:hypothetical protein
MWKFYVHIFTQIGTGHPSTDPTETLELFRSIIPGMTIGIGLQVVLTILIKPIYSVVMYFDLKSRSIDAVREREIISLEQDPNPPINLG